jgi:hypothetical protein
VANINLFKDEAQTALFKGPVRTALQTLFNSVIKTNQFMMEVAHFFSDQHKTHKYGVGRAYSC